MSSKKDKKKKDGEKKGKASKGALAGRECPCCKKHCPLAKPRCSKGKAMRAKVLKDS